jgi:hypothetical protein
MFGNFRTVETYAVRAATRWFNMQRLKLSNGNG